MGPYVGNMSFMSESETLLNSKTKLKLVGKSTKAAEDKDGTPVNLSIMEFEEI